MQALNVNGASIPVIGLGTWELTGDHCTQIVTEALRVGYRSVDTAQMYGNEAAVGAGLLASGLPREDIFLTTKIWPDCAASGVLERTAEERLRSLNVGYLDLLLIHWPPQDVPIADTMARLSAVKRAGLTRHIGVSNFNVQLLEEAVATCSEPLVTNQVEYHPFLSQSKILDACKRHGLSLTAYCPLARSRVFTCPTICAIARRLDRSPAQITLRWLIQQEGVVAIPRTGTVARLGANLSACGFELNDDDMAAISRLREPNGRIVDSNYSPTWD